MSVRPVTDTAFRQMGSDARIVLIDGDPVEIQWAQSLLRDLERRWTRFDSSSEICRLNDASGPVQVSLDTAHVLWLAVEAWRLTGGAFDPTVLPALESAGYRSSFDEAWDPTPETVPPRPAPGCGDVHIDLETGWVHRPRGVRFDLGGLGKGHAADRVLAQLLASGAGGAAVSLGGDVRVGGYGPGGAAWPISVADPDDPSRDHVAIGVSAGAVATSTSNRRCWDHDGDRRHHLIDPRTGSPAVSDVVQVSVLAGEAVTAEVLASSALVLGAAEAARLVNGCGASAVLFTHDGSEYRLGDFESFVIAQVAA